MKTSPILKLDMNGTRYFHFQAPVDQKRTMSNRLKERFQQITEIACAIKLQFIEWRDFRLAAALIRSRWVIVTDSKFEENAPKWLKIGSRDDSAGLAPYFDMLNHANEEDYNCNYTYRDDIDRGYIKCCTLLMS